MTDKREELEYTKPEIIDYGDLRELTAQGGFHNTDVPMGAPVGPDGITSVASGPHP
jgi:hypothetical protein